MASLVLGSSGLAHLGRVGKVLRYKLREGGLGNRKEKIWDFIIKMASLFSF